MLKNKSLVTFVLLFTMIATLIIPTVANADASGLDKAAKIVVYGPGNAAVPGFEDGADENNNQFINALREKTGYANIEWNVLPTVEADINNVLNLLFSSGEYPDLVYLNGGRSIFLRYLAEGVWAPVDDAVATYGPAIKDLVTDGAWAAVAQGDKHYGIPNPMHTSYKGHLLGSTVAIREDWMKKLNLTAPKDIYEFKTFLQAVKDGDPAGNGETIPLVTSAGNSGNPLEGLGFIEAAFGMWTPYVEIDGELKNTKRLYLKDCVTYIKELYDAKLLDNEFLYTKKENRDEKITAQKAFAFNAGVFDIKFMRQTFSTVAPEASMGYLPLLKNNDGTEGAAAPFAVSNCHMIPVTSKHINEVVDIINTFLTNAELESFINFGTEGVHYNKVDGAYVPIEPAYSSIIYKIYYRMWFKPDIWWNNALLADFEPDIIKYDAVVPNGMSNTNIFNYAPTSEASLSYKAAVTDIFNEYIAKMIVGTTPIDSIDQMFAAADAAGYTEIEAADKAWYESTGKALQTSLK